MGERVIRVYIGDMLVIKEYLAPSRIIIGEELSYEELFDIEIEEIEEPESWVYNMIQDSHGNYLVQSSSPHL
jgi:hypothetical protein